MTSRSLRELMPSHGRWRRALQITGLYSLCIIVVLGAIVFGDMALVIALPPPIRRDFTGVGILTDLFCGAVGDTCHTLMITIRALWHPVLAVLDVLAGRLGLALFAIVFGAGLAFTERKTQRRTGLAVLLTLVIVVAGILARWVSQS
jgi:hypothetical protein